MTTPTNDEKELDEILYKLANTVEWCVEVRGAVPIDRTRETNAINEAKQQLLAWRDREVASRVIEELEQIKRLSNGKFGKQIVVTGDGQIVLQQLLKIYSYSVDRIANLKSEVEP